MIGCIVQARMGSSRLPGKVMQNLDEKNPVIFFVIQQLKNSKNLEKIIVATSNLDEDDIVENFVQKMNIDVFRGSSNDVLDRFYQCAKKFSLDIIVRITADNPLIDPTIVDNLIEKFTTNSYDYLTNSLIRTFPYGTEVEVFSFDALQKVWQNAKNPSEREHVTPYFYNNPTTFKIHNVEHSENISNLRWTIDRKNDLDLVKLLISKIPKRPILMSDIINLYNSESKLFEINKNFIPNEGYLKSLKEDEEYLNKMENEKNYEK